MASVQANVVVQTHDINNLPQSVGQEVVVTSGLLADLQLWSAAYLPLLDAVLGSQILNANLVIPLTLPGGLKGAPEAGNNQMIGALVRQITATPGQLWSNTYPGAAIATFQAFPNSAIVDLGAGKPMTVLEAFLVGITHTGTASDPQGSLLLAIQSAIKNDRSNRRGLVRRHRR